MHLAILASAFRTSVDTQYPTLAHALARADNDVGRCSGVRPFGVSLLAAGYDDDGPHLYQIDPSGSYWAWKASAIGKNMVNAKTFLEKRYNEDIEIEDAIHTAILTLKVCNRACSFVSYCSCC